MTYQAQWRAEDEHRVRVLDCLYLIDGRASKSHPMHATYTGLWIKYEGDDGHTQQAIAAEPEADR